MKKIAFALLLTVLTSAALAEESEMQSLLTGVSGTTISGYVDTSMNWQFGDKKTVPGRLNNSLDVQNGFNLNAVEFCVSKELSEDSDAWEAGYSVGLLMGHVAKEYPHPLSDGIALENAYIDLRAPVGNGLDFSFGLIGSINGYEAVASQNNSNFSHSYAYYLTHTFLTGGTVKYTFDINDWLLTTTAGIGNCYTSYTSFNARGSDSLRFSYMGGLDLIFPESTGFLEGAKFHISAVNGLDGDGTLDRDSQPNQVDLNTFVCVPLPVKGLSFSLVYDYVGRPHRDGLSPVSSGWANIYALYVDMELSEKLSVANRLEYAEATTGAFVLGYPEAYTLHWGDKKDEFIADTFTVSYKLYQNILTRLEFRWDHDLSHSCRMKDDFSSNDAFEISGQVCYSF